MTEDSSEPPRQEDLRRICGPEDAEFYDPELQRVLRESSTQQSGRVPRASGTTDRGIETQVRHASNEELVKELERFQKMKTEE